MKKQLLLLVNILLPLISSCNSNPTIEPTMDLLSSSIEQPTDVPTHSLDSIVSSNQDTSTEEISTEEIYYLDGLASNLFVDEYVEELFEFIYIEEKDCYSTELSYIRDSSIYYETIVIPNVYDDGINGLKRVKYAGVNSSYESKKDSMTINNIYISEGIISLETYRLNDKSWFFTPITSFNCKNLYIPLSLEKISSIIEYYDYFEKVLNGEFKIYYPETTQYFYDNCEFVDIVTYEHYKLAYEIELICTNGSIMFETYDYKIF